MFVRVVAVVVGFLFTFSALVGLKALLNSLLVRLKALLNSRRSSVPDELYLQVAKTVIEGEFKGSHFGKKPFVDFFPTKKTCPHCEDGKRNPWDLGKAGRLLGDMKGLARAIKKRQFCRSCLSQLSGIVKVREQLGKLGKEDPRSLSFRPLGRGRTFLRYVGISIIVLVLSSLPGLLLCLLPFLLKAMVNLSAIVSRF